MSRHFCETTHNTHPVEVILGWDRPLQHVFMVVQKLNPDDGEDPFLYSNLYEEDPASLTLDYFREKLKEMSIMVPESMFVEVARDQINNTGNRDMDHTV